MVPSRDYSALLQASRRLDWQFLMPQPDLERVAYLGPAGSGLAKSLELLATSLTCLEGPLESQGPPGGYDLLVMVDPAAGDIQKWSGLVRPGGSIYIETYGWLGRWKQRGAGEWGNPGQRPTFRSAQSLIARLGSIGFNILEVSWHWPDFEACTRIISLKEESALIYLVSKGRQAGGVGTALARRLVKSGLFVRFVPCLSILACRPE